MNKKHNNNNNTLIVLIAVSSKSCKLVFSVRRKPCRLQRYLFQKPLYKNIINHLKNN